jgi:hypothetical protein
MSKPPIDPDPTGFVEPLGPEAEGCFQVLTPGDRLKNVPEDYFYGSVGGQIHYWRRRAEAAEARIVALRKELDALKGTP